MGQGQKQGSRCLFSRDALVRGLLRNILACRIFIAPDAICAISKYTPNPNPHFYPSFAIAHVGRGNGVRRDTFSSRISDVYRTDTAIIPNTTLGTTIAIIAKKYSSDTDASTTYQLLDSRSKLRRRPIQ